MIYPMGCDIILLSTRTDLAGFCAYDPQLTTHCCAQTPCFDRIKTLHRPGRRAGSDQGRVFAIMVKSINSKVNERTFRSNRSAVARGAFGKIPAKDVLLRMELQNWECFYCQQKITLFTCELDHVHAISKGGEHYLYNILLTCHTCNAVKHARSLKRFCQVMGLDVEIQRQRIAELNAKQHSMTDFDDEYANDASKWTL